MIIYMTKEEWDRKHGDFKTIIDGVKYVLSFIPGKGTSLVGVEIREPVDSFGPYKNGVC